MALLTMIKRGLKGKEIITRPKKVRSTGALRKRDERQMHRGVHLYGP